MKKEGVDDEDLLPPVVAVHSLHPVKTFIPRTVKSVFDAESIKQVMALNAKKLVACLLLVQYYILLGYVILMRNLVMKVGNSRLQFAFHLPATKQGKR